MTLPDERDRDAPYTQAEREQVRRIRRRRRWVLILFSGVDWVLCQVTSNPYGDPGAMPVTPGSFAAGGLGRESFARPGKLFTASESLFVKTAGQLTTAAHRELVRQVVSVLQSGEAVEQADAADEAQGCTRMAS